MSFHETAVAACNQALAYLRQDDSITLAQLDGSSSGGANAAIARKCRYVYDSARLEVLMSYDWNFARREVAVGFAPSGRPREFRFTMPFGAAKLVRVRGEGREDDLRYRVVGDVVYCEGRPRVVEYQEDVEDLDRWPPLLRRAFVYCLARDLAIPVTGRQSDLKNMDELYRAAIRPLSTSDARETHPDPWKEGYYPAAMRGAGGRRRGRWQNL